MAARIQEQRAEAEATRLALRAEADKLMRSLGHEASGRASHLLAERIGAIEAELEPVHARIAQLDAQMQALQRAGLVATLRLGRWDRKRLREMAETYGTKATLALVEGALQGTERSAEHDAPLRGGG